MNCPYCGVENDENAMYCYFCGRVLPGKEWNLNLDQEDAIKKKKSNRVLKIMLGVLGGLLAASLAFLAVMIIRDSRNDKPDPKEIIEAANESYEKKDYMSAAARYDQVLELEPENEEALHGSVMSKLYFVAEELGKYSEEQDFINASLYLKEYQIDDYIEDAKDLGIEFPIMCETRFGQIGFYLNGEREYYAYIGEYEGDLRNGYGYIVATNVSDFVHGKMEFYIACGDWVDDKPNGRMKVIKEGSVSRSTWMEGEIKDGLWVGKVSYVAMDYNNEVVLTTLIEFDNGLTTYKEEFKDETGEYYIISQESQDSIGFVYQPVDAAGMTYGIITFSDIL